jgi:hypothetical protein
MKLLDKSIFIGGTCHDWKIIYFIEQAEKFIHSTSINSYVFSACKLCCSRGYLRIPYAILLIHKDYELDNPGNLWVPIPYVDYSQKRKWISVISTEQNFNRSYNYYAAYILDQNGKRVGVWYSVEKFATVKFLEGNKVLVYTPELNQHHSILSDLY